MTGTYCIMHDKDQDTLKEQSWTALDQPMLGKVLKDQDTLIEQSPWYEILQQNSHIDLNSLNSAMNIINSQ